MKFSNEFPVSRQTGGVSGPVNWGGRGSDHRWHGDGDWTSCRDRFSVFRTYGVFPAHGFTFLSIIEDPRFEVCRAC